MADETAKLLEQAAAAAEAPRPPAARAATLLADLPGAALKVRPLSAGLLRVFEAIDHPLMRAGADANKLGVGDMQELVFAFAAPLSTPALVALAGNPDEFRKAAWEWAMDCEITRFADLSRLAMSECGRMAEIADRLGGGAGNGGSKSG